MMMISEKANQILGMGRDIVIWLPRTSLLTKTKTFCPTLITNTHSIVRDGVMRVGGCPALSNG
eukprot:scaffold4734_cov261-Chaetoceros_neogracile.AAC.6